MLQETQNSLFSGCGFVPDILSLQTWLEVAWKAGFDTAGGDMLGNVMQGSHQWIGTTECAALLRFFGLKAQIIDFTGAALRPAIASCQAVLRHTGRSTSCALGADLVLQGFILCVAAQTLSGCAVM